MSARLDVLVVGGGAAGLATAYWLQRAGLRYAVLEADQVGHVWTRHYESLRLHTLKAVSALPGLSMPRDYPNFPTGPEVARYLNGYAQTLGLAVEARTPVRSVERPDSHWRVETEQGVFQARVLIMATGIWGKPFRPSLPGAAAFVGDVIHSVDYRNPDCFRSQRILVIGVGNSGAEIAAELGRAGIDTTLSVRDGATFIPKPRSATVVRAADWAFRHLPRSLGNRVLDRLRPDFAPLGLPRQSGEPLNAYPVVGFGLPEAVRAGQVRAAAALTTLTAREAIFTDGRRVEVDRVILATGFRPVLDLARPYLSFDARDWPVLNGGRSTRVPTLWCVGLTYPATAGWLQSIGRLTRDVVARVRLQV